jgi:hypothetical protein
MATRDQILQAEINTQNFLAGSAIFLIQASANWNTSGYSATAFPTKLDDIINLSGSNIGTAKTANGWRNIGHTGDIKVDRSRTTQDLGSAQLNPARTLHDAWQTQVTVTSLETSPANLADFMQADSAGVQSVSGGAVAQSSLDFGAPSSIPYRRVAVLHPDLEGRLWGYVFAMGLLVLTGGPTFNRTQQHEWALRVDCYPDTRIANVDARVERLYHTGTGLSTG